MFSLGFTKTFLLQKKGIGTRPPALRFLASAFAGKTESSCASERRRLSRVGMRTCLAASEPPDKGLSAEGGIASKSEALLAAKEPLVL